MQDKEDKNNRAVIIVAVLLGALLAGFYFVRTRDEPSATNPAALTARTPQLPAGTEAQAPAVAAADEDLVEPLASAAAAPDGEAPAGAGPAGAGPAGAAAHAANAPAVAMESAAPREVSPQPKQAVAAAPEAKESAAPSEARSGVDLQFREDLPWMVATLIEVQIDGENVAKTENLEGIGSKLSWPLTQQQVKNGVRQLDVTVKLVGDSKAFPYLSGYTFTMKKSAAIPIDGNTIVRLEATPKGNATDDWTQRVNLEFHVMKAPKTATAKR